MAVKIITSPSNPIIKDIKALELRKRRKESGLFIVEGLRAVREGVELGFALKYLAYHQKLEKKQELGEVVGACEAAKGLVLEVNEDVLEKISRKDNPQSVIGVFEQKLCKLPLMRGRKGEQSLSKSANHIQSVSKLVVLEQARDPGNLGTIIRTVDAVAADGVVMVGACCDPYSIECVRASMGSIFAVPIYQTDTSEFLDWVVQWRHSHTAPFAGDEAALDQAGGDEGIRKPGMVIATALQGAIDFRDYNHQPGQPYLLLMGNEQAGLSAELRHAADVIIKLPMIGRADSLNLAVSTGICLYALEHLIGNKAP